MNDSAKIDKTLSLPVGVLLRRTPGVTRWAAWAWKGLGLVPHAGPADFAVIREADGATDFHVATVPLTLFRDEVESYRTSLMMSPPSAFVVLNKGADAGNEHGLSVHLVTASADLAMEYQDSAEVTVEPLPLPGSLISVIRDFCEAHYEEREFKKRRRDKKRVDLKEDGIGDRRIRQVSDVYRSPAGLKGMGDE